MKNTLMKAIVLMGVVMSLSAFADDSGTGSSGQGHHRKGFFMGVCVGQTLAAQGVTLPKPQPGQKPTWNDATKAAFKSAVQSCKAQFQKS